MEKNEFTELHHAERNTLLAYERTYAAWVRTGLTSLAAAIGIERLFSGTIPFLLMRSLTLMLIFLSIVSFTASAMTYLEVKKIPFVRVVPGTSPHLLTFLSLLMVCICLLTLVAIWKFNPLEAVLLPG
ncbi:MAG: DUF202 domain-containing protein [Waddliaceae bacterium]